MPRGKKSKAHELKALIEFSESQPQTQDKEIIRAARQGDFRPLLARVLAVPGFSTHQAPACHNYSERLADDAKAQASP
jgi:hypothetical protein